MERLRAEFLNELKKIHYDYWDEFVSTMMEQNTCLKTHLTRMYDIYELLTEVWGDWMDDSFATKAVLRLLPPSYKEIKANYIPQSHHLSFNKFLSEIMRVRVEPIAGEIIDSTGIFDILIIINVSPNMFAISSI